MLKLYKFNWSYGRMGNLSGIFVAEDSDIAEAIGKEVYFGEVLGKHSEVYGTLNEDDFTVLTEDQDFISKFEKLNCETGYNPLSYLNDEN